MGRLTSLSPQFLVDDLDVSTAFYRDKLVFVVTDVAAMREKLVEMGVRVGKHHSNQQFECCDFKDPDGNVLQISSR